MRARPAAHLLWALALLMGMSASEATRTFLGTDNGPESPSSSENGLQCAVSRGLTLDGATFKDARGVASLGACCDMCSADPRCYRFTYQPKHNRCMLKKAEGWRRRVNVHAVSGRVVCRGGSSSDEGTGNSTSPLPLNPVPSPEPAPSPKPEKSEKKKDKKKKEKVRSPRPPVAREPLDGDNHRDALDLAPFPSDGKSFTNRHYADVLGLSWWFYEAQRSGELPAGYRVPWRRAAHTSDVIPGGWYDAGDHLKLNFPLAASVSYLSWGLLEFNDGYAAAGQTQHALENLRAAVDYLKNCHVAPRRYIGQIGHPSIDHSFWGRPDQQTGARPVYVYNASTPAPDLFAKVSAALASSSLVWRSRNASYAADLLKHARQMYEWADETSASGGKYSDYYRDATAAIYPSTDVYDDLAWAAYWMYRATEDRGYLEDAVSYWKKKGWGVSVGWDQSGAAAGIALANLAQDGVAVPSAADIKTWASKNFVKQWTEANGEVRATPGGLHTPTWGRWGNLQLSTSAAFVALVHAKHAPSNATRDRILDFARAQIDYALGSSGRSYVVGYGTNPPLRPHHRGASCPGFGRIVPCDWANFHTPKPNPFVLYGALVGGPEGPGDDTYRDSREDYVSNEVSVVYNAGFTGALAGLVELV